MNDNDEDYSGAIAMALEMKLTPKVTHTLFMTLQQRQALKILQLARAELDTLIDETLAENPVVERVDEDEETGPDESLTVGEEPITDTPPDELQESDWQKYLDGYEDIPRLPPTGGDDESPEGRLNLVENQPNRPKSLEQHLLEQLRLSELTAEEEQIAFLIIGDLDTDGYVQILLADLATNAGIGAEMVEHVLQLIQACDPPGVGARDLQECLLLQLRAQEPEDPASENPIVPLATTIVRDHLHALEGRCFEQLAKDLGVPVEAVTRAVRLIAALEPKPGRNFGGDEIHYVTPDVYVHKVDEEYVVILNEEGLPRLKVNQAYRWLLKQEGEAKEYIQEKIRAAAWLIKSIHQRQHTLLAVAQSLVKFQQEFLNHGVSQMRPLVLRDVAEDVRIHESTVSRAIANKYISTPRGIYALKRFFTAGLKGPQGQDIAAESVKERIREIILTEDPAQPLSDEEIAQTLSRKDARLARRTVAKYRKGLGIPSSTSRSRCSDRLWRKNAKTVL